MNTSISVIIPCLNEADNLNRLLPQLCNLDQIQVVVVDGGSSDNSESIARQHGCLFIQSPQGRGRQMNTGVQVARYRHLLFLHADTRLPLNFQECVERALSRDDVVGGAFSLATDSPRLRLKLVCAMANLRAKYLQLPYGDQAIFTIRSQFEAVGGYPEIAIMEDYVFIRKLAQKGRIALCPEYAVTSARRWNSRGVFRTTLINQLVIIGYLCGVSPMKLAKLYRRS